MESALSQIDEFDVFIIDEADQCINEKGSIVD